jgi:hypothetical protein
MANIPLSRDRDFGASLTQELCSRVHQVWLRNILRAKTLNILAMLLCSIVALAAMFTTGVICSSQTTTHSADLKPFSTEYSGHAAVISPSNVVWQMLDQVNRNRIVNDLRRLTGEEPICTNAGCFTAVNRGTGSEGLHWAMEYIYEELVSLGYSVEFRDWSRSGWNDRNLIARRVGVSAPTEEVYFVAHVDGVELTPGERFPAADDNASGTVDILEVARVMSTYSFSRTVVLLFSTGEEHGALGVRGYLDQLSSEELSSIKYAVDIDVVGYDADRDTVMQLWGGDHPPSVALTQVMSETMRAYRLGLAPRLITGCT